MTGKQTLPKVTVTKGNDWVKVLTGAYYMQNTDDEPVTFALGDIKPTISKEDGHVMYPFSDYVNDAFDTIWVHASPHKEHIVTISKFGTV